MRYTIVLTNLDFTMPHIHEKIDFTVSAYIVFGHKVLIRLHDKYNIWIGVGGHIELDEDANAALLREVKEEVGLNVEFLPPPMWKPTPISVVGLRDLIPPNYMNIHQINETHQHHDLIYFVRTPTDKVIPESPADQWKWLTKKEVLALDESDISDEVKHYCLEALALAAADEATELG